MVKTDITLFPGYTPESITQAICERLPISASEIKDARLIRRVLDLSDTKAPRYKCTVAFSASADREAGLLKMRNKVHAHEEEIYSPPHAVWDFKPVVVGAGPAGLFAALTLAEAGACPIVLERGLEVRERRRKVELYNTFGILDPECNVQFGEGGAGTFSDGKLKVGAMDAYKRKIISELISTGATEDIAFSSTAHVGTDKLAIIVEKIREKIVDLGGSFIFGARMTSIAKKNATLAYIEYEKDGTVERIETGAAILATGHSARDTAKMLYEKGLLMEARPFGVGMRLEHKREYINRLVYRESADIIDESASYHLVTHLPSGRSVYSFCMCPGGTVVAAASEEGGIVTNGMSEYARMADNSNAAILVSIEPEDFPSAHPLAGIEFQRMIEKRAYELSGSAKAPAIRLEELMFNKKSESFGDVLPSYPCGTVHASAKEYMPDYITDSIREGIVDFEEWLPGYAFADAVFTGPETRSTSPVRILRDERGEALGYPGVFPCGEGAGYSGGIISSANDGIKQAERLVSLYARCKR